jgi:mRNA-degrading endonuclease RelE of RelBE toxin-antitoxin system
MDAREKQHIRKGIESLPGGDVKPMEGYADGSMRLRIGKFRVIFTAENDAIIIRNVGSRGDIYK